MTIRNPRPRQPEAAARAARPDKAEETIDLVELFYVLLNRWYLIVACALLGALLFGGFAKLFIKPTYQATAKLYVVASSGDSVVDLTDLNIGTSLTNDYRELILSYPVLERVTAAIDPEMTVDRLRGLITLSNPTNTRVLVITVTCGDPEQAAEIANTLAGVAQEYLPETMSTVRPNMAQVAKVPTGKYAPSISRYAMVGGLLGLLLSVGWLTVRMLMDDTIHSSEDWEKSFEVPLLTVIAEYDTGKNETAAQAPRPRGRGRRRAPAAGKRPASGNEEGRRKA